MSAPASARKPRIGWRFTRHVLVRVGAQGLRIAVLQGRDKPVLLAAVSHSYASANDALEPAQPVDLAQAFAGLAPALARVQAKLDADGHGSLRGLACDVLIDDSWMLYDVVHADLRSLSPRAADSLIGASLADVAGVSPTELISRWQAQGKSPYTLACGLPADAMPALAQALATHRLVMNRVEGEFVYEYNRHRPILESKCAVLAVVRDAGAQMAVLVDGVLTSMSFEYGVDSPKELEQRGRGLLRIAGAGGADSIRFYAVATSAWKAPEPWVCLPAAA